MTNILDELNSQNRILLYRLEQAGKAEIVPEIEMFLNRLAAAGTDVKDPRQRSTLRNMILFWKNILRDYTGQYPKIELFPPALNETVNSLDKDTKIILYAAVIFALLVLVLITTVRSSENRIAFLWSTPTSTLTPTLTSTPTPTSTPTLTPTATPTPTPTLTPTATPTPTLTPTPLPSVFNIYTDAAAPDNHFVPSGYFGDIGDIEINERWIDDTLHPSTSVIKITYSAEGKGPHICGDEEETTETIELETVCKSAGVYWQTPPNNWGTVQDAGYDLGWAKRLEFWARSDTEIYVEFKVGGIRGKYPDSIQPPLTSGVVALSPQWQQFTIDLAGADLSYVIGGFVWVANWPNNGINEGSPRTLVFYLGDIRFER